MAIQKRFGEMVSLKGDRDHLQDELNCDGSPCDYDVNDFFMIKIQS